MTWVINTSGSFCSARLGESTCGCCRGTSAAVSGTDVGRSFASPSYFPLNIHRGSFSLAPLHPTPPHPTPPRLTSPHLTPHQLTSLHLTSPHLASPHLGLPTSRLVRTRGRLRIVAVHWGLCVFAANDIVPSLSAICVGSRHCTLCIFCMRCVSPRCVSPRQSSC